MTLEQGQVIKDRYRVAKMLGKDDFGAVYRAWDLNMDSGCALEEVFDPSGGMGRWFERRAAQLAKIRHDNLPKILDVFSLPMHGHYLVLEFIEGQDLGDMLAEQGMLDEDRLLPWVSQVCDTLSYLHVQEPPIIHGAVKPGNVRITGEDQAVLVGFRVASVLVPEEGIAPGAEAASLGFSSPEMYGKGRIQVSSDVYALGATLYRLLTGEMPPDSPLVLGKDLPPPESVYELNPQISYTVSKAIQRAMEIDPEERFSSVEAFKRAFTGAPELYAPAPPSFEAQPEAVSALPLHGAETVVFPPSAPIPSEAVQAGEPEDVSPTHGAPTVAQRPSSPPPKAKRRRWGLWVGGLVVLLLVLVGLCVGGYFLYPTVFEMVRTSTLASTATMTATLAPIYTYTPTMTQTLEASPTFTPLPTQMVDDFNVTMVLVEAGSFKMGSKMGEEGESPEHTLTLGAFYMDHYEVTNSLYDACVQAGVCKAPLELGSNTRPDYYTNQDYADFPVIHVTWEMAKAYCEWRGGSLPNEAQWEKAARGDDLRTFPWGEGADCSLANFWGEEGNCVGDTTEVGSYPGGVSPYGIFDLAGNVWEWVLDWYDPTYYGVSPAENPSGPVAGQLRVIRGGSWAGGMFQCRTTTRGRNLPSNGYNYVGFRCVRTP